MTDFTTLTDFSFRFDPHPHSEPLAVALDNTYSEPFEDATVVAFFTDTGRTALVPDIVARLCTAIIDIIDATSQADRAVIAPIINSLILGVQVVTRQFLLRSPGTFRTALLAHIRPGRTSVVVSLNTVSLYIASSTFNALSFEGILTTAPPAGPPTVKAPTGTGAAGAAAAAATAAAAVSAAATLSPAAAAAAAAATAANTALLAQQAAAAAVAAVSPTTFDFRNLPTAVKDRHLHHLDPSYLMTGTK